MEILNRIHENAIRLQNRIVLPEGTEERTLKAASIALKNKLAKIILLGNETEIKKKAQELNINIDNATIIDPTTSSYRAEYVEKLVEIRKNKGLTKEEAEKLLDDPLYFAVMMIKNGDADGEVGGAMNATANVLRPAFQIIKTKPGISVVSGAFMMVLPDKNFGDNGIMFFADCAVHPDPDEKQLAEIAIATSETAKALANIKPRVAMLSFSTKGSASHPFVDKVVKATNIVKQTHPEILIDGELQADTAIIETIGKRKAPDSPVAGKANILIFPDLQSGNISYKLVQRMAKAEAIGPVLQGMAAPINDLSRGCSVQDIVNMIAITSNQANKK